MQEDKPGLAIAVIAASLFVLLLVIAAFMLFRIYLKRKNKLLLEKERMAILFEQTLLKSKLEIQEETFTHISREIHDNIGQVLSLARLNINTLQSADQQKIDTIDNLMGKALTDLRNLSHSLDSDMIKKAGWIKASQRLLADLEKSGTCNVSFQSEENLPTLGSERPIILFRMIQEIINNIIKHASAKQISFRANKSGNKIDVEIKDDGKGFDRSIVSPGAGLQNLETRAKMIDAIVYIHTQPGSGTSITISLNV